MTDPRHKAFKRTDYNSVSPYLVVPGGAQRLRTGHNNADLMGYIDSKLSEAGCYG